MSEKYFSRSLHVEGPDDIDCGKPFKLRVTDLTLPSGKVADELKLSPHAVRQLMDGAGCVAAEAWRLRGQQYLVDVKLFHVLIASIGDDDVMNANTGIDLVLDTEPVTALHDAVYTLQDEYEELYSEARRRYIIRGDGDIVFPIFSLSGDGDATRLERAPLYPAVEKLLELAGWRMGREIILKGRVLLHDIYHGDVADVAHEVVAVIFALREDVVSEEPYAVVDGVWWLTDCGYFDPSDYHVYTDVNYRVDVDAVVWLFHPDCFEMNAPPRTPWLPQDGDES